MNTNLKGQSANFRDHELFDFVTGKLRAAVGTQPLHHGHISTCRGMGHVFNQTGQVCVMQGDTVMGWRLFHLGAMYYALEALARPRYAAQAEVRAGLMALALGEIELGLSVADGLGADRAGQFSYLSTAHLLLGLRDLLVGDAPDREWLSAPRIGDYASLLGAVRGGHDWQTGAAHACELHMKLMGVDDAFYADPLPLDVVAAARVYQRVHGETPDPPDHPLMKTPLAAIPSVLAQPDLREHDDDLIGKLIVEAHKAQLLPVVPGQRADSKRWPAPPGPWPTLPELPAFGDDDA